MNHHGKILLHHIYSKGKTKKFFCDHLNIHRQTLHVWSQKKKFNDHILNQIMGKFGITQEMFTMTEGKRRDLQQQIDELKEIILHLQTSILKLTNK